MSKTDDAGVLGASVTLPATVDTATLPGVQCKCTQSAPLRWERDIVALLRAMQGPHRRMMTILWDRGVFFVYEPPAPRHIPVR